MKYYKLDQHTNSMHIHPSSPNSPISEENAATKIQAGFRGYRVRKLLKENNGNDVCNGAVGGGGATGALTLNSSRSVDGDIKCRKNGEIKNHINNNNINNNNNKNMPNKNIEEKSATKIQAGIRGYLVRKKQKLAADAATKIQASFRGFRTRKDLKKPKDK